MFPQKTWRSYEAYLVFLLFGQSTFHMQLLLFHAVLEVWGSSGSVLCAVSPQAGLCFAALSSGCCLWGYSGGRAQSLPHNDSVQRTGFDCTGNILGCVYPQCTDSPLRRHLQCHLPNGFCAEVTWVQGSGQLMGPTQPLSVSVPCEEQLGAAV